MNQLSYEITEDLNESDPLYTASPSQPNVLRSATRKGFSFSRMYGDKKGTRHIDYKPAKIYRGQKWFVYYSYFDGDKFKRFKVYEDINRYTGPAREQRATFIREAVDYALKSGYDPFKDDDFTFVKTWTLVQGLNKFKQDLPERGLRKRTIQSYESVLRQMYKGLSAVLQKEISTITRGQIFTFLNDSKRENSWSNTTYNNNITALRAIFNYLIDQEIMTVNPARLIKPLPAQATKHRYFDDETWDKIKANADPRLFRFLMFLYHTATRPNEARQLRYEHILRDRKLLLVPSKISKNKKDDYVPLSDYILENFRGEGLIFGTSVNYFTQKFNKLKTKLKLPKEMSLYSIKATRAIHLAEDGASPYSIMALFRHSGLDITMKYLRGLSVNINREAAEKVRPE